MHLTKHLLQDSSGVTFTVVIRGDPALASDTGSPQHKGQHGGREGWSRREEGAVLLSSHEHQAPAKLQTP